MAGTCPTRVGRTDPPQTPHTSNPSDFRNILLDRLLLWQSDAGRQKGNFDMDISSVGSSSSILDIDSVAQARAQATLSADTSGPATTPKVSDRAKQMSALSDLEKSDPAKFKRVTADIATKLHDEASSLGGTKGAALDKLADKFEQASKSGDMSVLKTGGGHGHHGGGHHKVQQYATQQISGSSAQQGPDAADLIKSVMQDDGVKAAA